MAERGHVLEAGAEQSRRNPACELADKALLREQAIKIGKISVEAQYAATARSIGIIPIEIEQEGVGIQRHVHRIRAEIAQIDFIHLSSVKKEVEEWAQHQHKGAAVSRGSGEIRPRLHNGAVAQPDVHKEWDLDGNFVHHLRNDQRVPVVFHGIEELGAVNGVSKLDVTAGAVGERLKVGRLQEKLLERIE